MKTKGISFALILLVGSVVAPVEFSYAQTSNQTVPTPPRELTATAISSSQINLNWLPPLNNGGSPLTGYKIETRIACTGNFILVLSSATNTITSYSNTGLTNSTCYQYRVFALNAVGPSLPSNNATATTGKTNQTTTDIDNLGQQVSKFVQQRNAFFKQQREDTIKTIRECNEKVRNTSFENRTEVKAECKDRLHALREKYKDTRKQFQEEFKIFRDSIKSQMREIKDLKMIEREDVREFKKDLKEFEKETKKEDKKFKKEIKEIKKKIKEKKLKKDNRHNEDD